MSVEANIAEIDFMGDKIAFFLRIQGANDGDRCANFRDEIQKRLRMRAQITR